MYNPATCHDTNIKNHGFDQFGKLLYYSEKAR